MVRNEKIRTIYKELKVHKKLSYNKFKKIIVEKKELMAAQTFADRLKEAVESGIIRREEGLDGKRKVVFYSIPEIAKIEDEYLDHLSSTLTGFQQEYDRLEDLFPMLNDVEKGQILIAFIDWIYALQAKISLGHSRFNSPKFADLSHFLSQYTQYIDELIMSGDEKQQSAVWNEMFMGWGSVEEYNNNIIDDLLETAEHKAMESK